MKRCRATMGRRGFTLTELLVAVVIAGLLILAVAQVFASVAGAVDRGASTGHIINSGRVIADQLRRDGERMVGPREGAVMVIANDRTGDVAILPEDVDAGVSRQVRSDQLMFIRRRGDLQPLSPSDSDSLTNVSSAEYAKVWVGHTLRATVGGGPSGSLSGPALDWTLGRQALFLESDPTLAPAEAAFADASTDGLGSGLAATLRHGLADVAHYGLNAERSDNDPDNDEDAEHGAITGDEPSFSGSGADPNEGAPLYHDRRLWRTLEPNEYAGRAYDYTYLDQRLLSRAVPAGGDYEAWQVAQMHPVLARHVTDVVVEFAGDYFVNGSAEISPGANPDGVGGLDATPDGRIDRYHTASGDQQIIWYGLDVRPPLLATADASDPAGAFVGGAETERSHSPISDGTPTDSDGDSLDADHAYVFRHGPGLTNWPHLIRIRYRVHDAAGRIRGTDDRPGVWFEQVLHVNRDG